MTKKKQVDVKWTFWCYTDTSSSLNMCPCARKRFQIYPGGPHLTLVTSVQPQATLHSFWLRPGSYFLHLKTSDSFTSSYVDIYWFWDVFFFLERTRKRTHKAKTKSSLQNLLHDSVIQLNDTITQVLLLLLKLLEKHSDSYFSTSHCPLLCWCPDVYVPHTMLLILLLSLFLSKAVQIMISSLLVQNFAKDNPQTDL